MNQKLTDWKDVKMAPKSVHKFLNKIDMNAMNKNIELMFKENN